jgi:hypothetical protein
VPIEHRVGDDAEAARLLCWQQEQSVDVSPETRWEATIMVEVKERNMAV